MAVEENGKTRITMRAIFATAKERDHVVKSYNAVEGGNQTLGRLADYVEQQNKKFVSKWIKNEKYLSNPKFLKTALDEYEKLLFVFGTSGNEGYYLSLRTNQDQLDTELKALGQR